MRRFRLVDVGVVAALAAAAVTAVGLVQADAVGSGTASSYVPIVPCRLVDTRAGADNVGTRATPLGAGESVSFPVWGTNGACTIPTNATGVATNTTAVNPTASSYITIYPSDANPRPTASNLNVVAGGAPTPNQVTVGLSADGAISAYNNGGFVDLIIDIVGYYQPSSAGTGTQGAKGDKGDPGQNGAPGPACPVGGCVESIQAQHAIGGTGFGFNECSGGVYLTLPLDLPGGAIITKLTVQYLDTDTRTNYDFNFHLAQQIVTPTTVTSGDATGTGNIITTLNGVSLDLPLKPAAATPVGPNLRYTLTASMSVPASSSTVLLCGAVVYYHF